MGRRYRGACQTEAKPFPDSEEYDVDNDVDIVITGRHTQVTDRFRAHLEEKLPKVPHLFPGSRASTSW